MCARYSLGVSETARPKISIPDRLRRLNIAPSQEIAAFGAGFMLLEGATWGMKPVWSKSLIINARSETAAAKPFYKGLMKSHRCLIPATGFYEWKSEAGKKQPYFFGLKDRAPFWMAGLWRAHQEAMLTEVVILTTGPNRLMAAYHDRMPVILSAEDAGEWLDEQIMEPIHLLPLTVPARSDIMEAFPVNPAVGKPGYQEKDAVTPWTPSSLFENEG